MYYTEPIYPENMTFSALRQLYPEAKWSLTRLEDGRIVAHGSDFNRQMARVPYHFSTGSFWYYEVTATISTEGGRVRVVEYEEMSEEYSW